MTVADAMNRADLDLATANLEGHRVAELFVEIGVMFQNRCAFRLAQMIEAAEVVMAVALRMRDAKAGDRRHVLLKRDGADVGQVFTR